MSSEKNHGLVRAIARVVFFLALFSAIFYFIQKPFRVTDTRMYQHVQGFYAEKSGSLDAVYVGSSNVYPWYEPPTAWNNYGITTFDLSVPGMPARAVRYVIEEARKTQPDALYIVNLNNFKGNQAGYVRIHNVADYMKLSRTKLDLINDLAEHSDIPVSERLEFIFPFIRFHTGWSELTTQDFGRTVNGMKGGDAYEPFFERFIDESGGQVNNDSRVEPKDYQKENFNDLLTYLKENDVRALFVCVPQMPGKPEVIGRINSLADIAESEGFDVLNLWDEESDITDVGIDTNRDYQDPRHVNVHGSQKYTKYLAEYLQSNYGFADKRGTEEYSDWDAAFEKYKETVSPYTLPFELENSGRTLDIDAPMISKCKANGTEISLEWNAVENADGYEIYRKRYRTHELGTTAWEKLATVDDADITKYTDSGLREKKTYYYIVVPVRHENGETVYGRFDYAGAYAKTAAAEE